MPKTLSKVEKKIVKKRGKVGILHEKSRDATRLIRANARAIKLDSASASKARASQPLLQRVAAFQEFLTEAEKPVKIEDVHTMIQTFLNRELEDLVEIQAQRRPGRPPSVQEERVRLRMDKEDKEYNSGFWLPDMEDEKNTKLLEEWPGDWGSLNAISFVRLTRSGQKQRSSFPPSGAS